VTNLGAIPRLLATAGRLLLSHWPALLVLGLLGMALREAALWGAVELSAWNSFTAQLLLVAAPLGYLLPVIAMLRICRSSLPRASAADVVDAPDAPTEDRERRLVDVAVGVLIPFLTVYAALGLHDQDFQRFFNSAAYAEWQDKGVDADFLARLGYYPLRIVLLIIVVSWVVRWALGRLERATGVFALAFVGALVETYYTGQLVIQVQQLWRSVTDWVETRRAWVGIQDGYHDVLNAFGALAQPLDAAVQALLFVLGSLELILVVPAAWLTVSAVVLGHKLIPAPSPDQLRLRRLGGVMQHVGDTLFDDLMDRWAVLWHGVRMVFRTGFATVAVFSAIFLVVARTPYWFSHLARWVVGPTETTTFLSFSLFEEAVGLALSAALIAPLLAAATEWLVLPTAAAIAREVPRTPGAGTGTSPTPR
jgi:hypothetical protein